MSPMPSLAVADPVRTSSDVWLLTASLNDPATAALLGDAFTHRGPVAACVHGVLFDRDELVSSVSRDAVDQSNADLVLGVYARGGDSALSRLRGVFVVTLVDR